MAFWKNTPSTDSPINATNLNNLSGGLTPILETITYASADAPTFVVNTSVDLTGVISLGYRIKLTQTTVKWFIVTAITSTTITLYGGTDYTLTNAAISNVYYSGAKIPFGFNANPDKWSVTFTDTKLRTQANPTLSQWYNLGNLSFVVPIGVFKLKYDARIAGTRTVAGNINVNIALGTANNTALASFIRSTESTPVTQQGFSSVSAENIVTLTAKQTYYINMSAGVAGMSGLFEGNGQQTLTVIAESAYL